MAVLQLDEIIAACTNKRRRLALFSATMVSVERNKRRMEIGKSFKLLRLQLRLPWYRWSTGSPTAWKPLRSPSWTTTFGNGAGILPLNYFPTLSQHFCVLFSPARITVGARFAAAATVQQELIFVGSEEGKMMAFRQLLQKGLKPPVLIFVQSKLRAQRMICHKAFVVRSLCS